MKLGVMKQTEVEAKTLKIHVKVSDRFSCQIVDQDGAVLKDQDDGYVPSFMPGKHYGDYIILDIDIDTGQVTNWKKIDPEELSEFINKRDDE